MVGTRLRYSFCDEKNSSLSDTMKIGAFADCKRKHFEPELIIPNAPFSKLFTEKLSPDMHSENESSKTVVEDEDKNGNSPTTESRTSGLTMVSTNDDFIMVDLKTPFASNTSNSELGKFYKEWQAAPPLQTFIDVPSIAEQELSKQLETFESDLNEYDSIVQSLCQSPNNN